MNSEAQVDRGKLVRGLGPLDATMIVVGSMIGSGIFITSIDRCARLVTSGLGSRGLDDDHGRALLL